MHGAALGATAQAKSVSLRDGQLTFEEGTTSGEAVAGYYLANVQDAEATISWAQWIPTARYGRVEVRQITEMANEPDATC